MHFGFNILQIINVLLLILNSYISGFKIFNHDELEEATNHFDTFLGSGGFGRVYYGKKLKCLSANFNDKMLNAHFSCSSITKL